MQPTLQDNQLMSKHRVLGYKPQLRLEWRGQEGQNETEQSDHSASLGDSITSSTQIRFSVHTTVASSDFSSTYMLGVRLVAFPSRPGTRVRAWMRPPNCGHGHRFSASAKSQRRS